MASKKNQVDNIDKNEKAIVRLESLSKELGEHYIQCSYDEDMQMLAKTLLSWLARVNIDWLFEIVQVHYVKENGRLYIRFALTDHIKNSMMSYVCGKLRADILEAFDIVKFKADLANEVSHARDIIKLKKQIDDLTERLTSDRHRQAPFRTWPGATLMNAPSYVPEWFRPVY